MHDPKVVVADIRLPIPKRARWKDAKNGQPRWTFGRRRRTNAENLGEPVYPWWRPNGYDPRIAGRAWQWRYFLTIWHNEPGGADSGTVCKGRGKRWHLSHLSIQWHQKQALRRWLITRCEWCGGPSRRNDPVNISHQWDREPGPWWRSERGLFHHDCSAIHRAHAKCLCDDPLLSNNGYGKCGLCGGFRAWESGERAWYHPGDEPYLILRSIPAGQRDASKYARASRLWGDYHDARRFAERATEHFRPEAAR